MKLENGKYVGGLSTRGSIVIARLGRSLIATLTFVTLIVIAATIGFVALVLNSVGTAAADEFYPPFNIQATGHYGACFSVTWQAEPTGVTSFSVERKEPFQRWEVPADQHDVWACGMEPGNWYDFEVCSWYGTPEGDTACAEARLQLIQTGNIDPSGRPPQPRIVETHFGETFIGVKWDAAGFEYDSYFVNYTLKGHGPNTIHHDDNGTWGYQLIEGLLPSRTYVLQVQGCTETFFGIGSDNCWDWSPPVEVTTAAAPPAAGGPQLPSYVASFESLNYPGHLMRHRNALGELTPVVSDLDRVDATFIVREGLSGAPDSVSFESVNFPGHFLRHNFSRIKLHANDGSDLFLQDATFMRRPAECRGVYCQVQFESVNYPGHFLRHSNFELWLAQDDSSELFKQDSTWRRLPPPFKHMPPGAVSFESFNYPGHFIRHRNSLGELTPVVSDLDRVDATFIVRAGLNGSPIGVSLESVNYPGHFLRHQDYRLKLHLNDGSDLFHQDATFYYQDGSCGEGNCPVSFESVNSPGHFIRHTNFELWLAQNDGSELFANDAAWQPVPPR